MDCSNFRELTVAQLTQNGLLLMLWLFLVITLLVMQVLELNGKAFEVSFGLFLGLIPGASNGPLILALFRNAFYLVGRAEQH